MNPTYTISLAFSLVVPIILFDCLDEVQEKPRITPQVFGLRPIGAGEGEVQRTGFNQNSETYIVSNC